jgi:hypothetical protein
LVGEYSSSREHGAASLRSARLSWLQVRDSCVDRDCLIRAYRQRIDALKHPVGASQESSMKSRPICDEIRKVFLSGAYRKHALDFKEMGDESHRVYDLYNELRPNALERVCTKF